MTTLVDTSSGAFLDNTFNIAASFEAAQDFMPLSTNTHRTPSRPHYKSRFLTAPSRTPAIWRPETSSLTREELQQIVLELLG